MEPTAITIPIHILDTLHPNGYAQRFWHFVQASGLTHREAYEMVENERVLHRIPERFSSYESFCTHRAHLPQKKQG